jgi:cytochrome c5
MKMANLIFFSLLILITIPGLSQTADVNKTAVNSEQKTKSTTVHVAQKRDGQKVFEENCSRCHTTPQGFSPRISGTVALHMRVRAGLSQDDEQAILRFLNP